MVAPGRRRSARERCTRRTPTVMTATRTTTASTRLIMPVLVCAFHVGTRPASRVDADGISQMDQAVLAEEFDQALRDPPCQQRSLKDHSGIELHQRSPRSNLGIGVG